MDKVNRTGPISPSPQATPVKPAHAPAQTGAVQKAASAAIHAEDRVKVAPTELAAPAHAAFPPPPPKEKPLKLSDLRSGAEDYNVYEVNSWVAHSAGAVDFDLMTMHEGELLKAIKERVGKTGHKLTMVEVVELSLKLNNGDVADALMTVHNAFRQAARGNITLDLKMARTERFAEFCKQPEFFSKYLDGRSIGLGDHPVDASGAWYHCFVTATIGFVGAEKGKFDSLYELGAGQNLNLGATAVTMLGQTLQNLPTTFVPATASLDMLGEQSAGLITSRGLADDVADEVQGELHGLALGALLALAIKK